MGSHTRILPALALGLALIAQTPAHAQQPSQQYPHKPVHIVVPFLAGGAVDVVARLMAEGLGKELGQSVVVENRAGAGGTIGADSVAKSAADGYTLLFTAQGPLVINPFLLDKLPYDALGDFAPISIVLEAPNVLAVRPTSEVKQFADMKAKSVPVTYATQGLGTTGHITGAMIQTASGVEMQHVPYRGFGPMLTDVIGGRVDSLITDTFNVVPRVRSGELRAVAVAAAERSPALPDTPTFSEEGYPTVVAGPWFALVAPAGTPDDVQKTLAAAVHKVSATGELAERIRDLGAISRTTPMPQDAADFVRSEYKRWGDAIQEGGVRPKS